MHVFIYFSCLGSQSSPGRRSLAVCLTSSLSTNKLRRCSAWTMATLIHSIRGGSSKNGLKRYTTSIMNTESGRWFGHTEGKLINHLLPDDLSVSSGTSPHNNPSAVSHTHKSAQRASRLLITQTCQISHAINSWQSSLKSAYIQVHAHMWQMEVARLCRLCAVVW